MSLKQSPIKKDDKTTSPKKDDKTVSSVILTRTQSTYLNTRQLRNKDSSRKKIFDFTQQLLCPMKDRAKTQSKTKRSPKDKKEKANGKKKGTVSVSSLVIEAKKEVKGRKRRMVAGEKAIRTYTAAPKRRRMPDPQRSPSTAELIARIEEHSLDDDDFMAILTAESPVWWEQPPDLYYQEDAIFSSPEEKRYFEEISKEQSDSKHNSIPKLEPDSINIPTVKQNDDRFMKKRNKLENVLGNIKNKLTDSQDDTINKNNIKSEDTLTNETKKDPNKHTDSSTSAELKEIKQEKEFESIRKVKTSSESTSSSEDMFLGFQNEEILKDLESIDIPIETDVNASKDGHVDSENSKYKYEPCLESTNESESCKDIKNEVPSKNKDETKDVKEASSVDSSKSKTTQAEDDVKINFKDSTSTKDEKTKETITSKEKDNSTILSKSSDEINAVNVEPNQESDIKTDKNIQNIEKDAKSDQKSDDNINSNENKDIESKNTKTYKSKTKINKEQLMTVYKIITDDEYREKYIKTIQSEADSSKTNETINILKTDNSLEVLKSGVENKSEDNRNDLNNTKNSDHNSKTCEIIDNTDVNLSNKVSQSNDYSIQNQINIKSNYDKCTDVNQIDSNESDNESDSTLSQEKISQKDPTACEDQNENKIDTYRSNCNETNKERSLNIISDVKSAKYCLKCSSIFESETCSYCEKKLMLSNRI